MFSVRPLTKNKLLLRLLLIFIEGVLMFECRFIITACVGVLLSWSSTAAEELNLNGNADAVHVGETELKFQFTGDLPKSQELRFPRLNARLKQAYWLGKESQQLTLIPEPDEWRVKLVNPPAETQRTVVVELLDAPQHHQVPAVATHVPQTGEIILPAHFSDTHGEKLRYEPQPHKNTVGYWTVESDWVDWTFIVKKSGDYRVDILQGCGTGQGGSLVAVEILQEKQLVDSFEFDVEETGHFQNFKKRQIGELSILKPGTYQLRLRPVKLAKKAVMDVREVRLVPNR